jgi:hypothetical protein
MHKPTLMIHEFKPEFLDLPLEDYILTFDDGLASQYAFKDELRLIKTPKIFFISTNIVLKDVTTQNSSFICCSTAHKKAFNGNYENYMSWDQIRSLRDLNNFFIGGHSHSHTRLNKFETLAKKVKYIKQDTREMNRVFEQELGLIPDKFCFPYNEDLDGIYGGLIRPVGILETFGSERTAIEDLL